MCGSLCVGTICHPDVCVCGGGGGGLSITLMCVGLSLTMMCVCVGGGYISPLGCPKLSDISPKMVVHESHYRMMKSNL